jgi:hypothetical protein
METIVVTEEKFIAILNQWHAAGRSLLYLPRVTRSKNGISVYLVSLDNTTMNTLERHFKNYQAYLSWYGELLDKIGYY